MTVPLILASGSAARRAMLDQVGVEFSVEPPDVDEARLKKGLTGRGADEVALALAEAKALAVSDRRPDALVLGSDQILELDGTLMDKAGDLEGARARLRRLRGRSHSLHSAAALARGGEVIWSGADRAEMTMRPYSDAFLERYLAAEGGGLLGSVGCYRLEGPGAQLFEKVEGDFFTVLGLPLWAVLAELRRLGAIAA